MASPIIHQASHVAINTTTPRTITVPAASAALASLAVVFYAQNATALTGMTVTDSASNTYTSRKINTVGRYLNWFQADNAASISGTISTAQSNGNAFGATYLELPPGYTIDDIEAFGNATAGTTGATAQATPTTSSGFIVSLIHWNGNTTSGITSPTGGFTAQTSGADVDGNSAWLNPGTNGSAAGPSWTGGTSNAWGSITASFKLVGYKAQIKQAGGTWLPASIQLL